MEQKRIRERNQLQEKIDRLQRSIERSNSCIRTSGASAEKVGDLKRQIKEKTQEIEALTERKNLVQRGALEEELSQKGNPLQETRNKAAEKKKADGEQTDLANKKISEAYRDRTFSDNQNQRQTRNWIRKEYNFYARAPDRLPRYIKDQLKRMPNNHGFIHNKIYWYGKKDPVRGPSVMFEPGRERNLVHEWHSDEYRVYEDSRHDGKVFVYSEPRERRR